MPGEFEGLDVYKKARAFRKRIWKLAQLLGSQERHVLVPQMRRASLSVTNNIAEGHGSWSYRHNVSYLRRARGSMNELLDDLNACEDAGYFKNDHLDDLRADAKDVIRLINGYISYLNKQLDRSRPRG